MAITVMLPYLPWALYPPSPSSITDLYLWLRETKSEAPAAPILETPHLNNKSHQPGKNGTLVWQVSLMFLSDKTLLSGESRGYFTVLSYDAILHFLN
jgi:hypothetical protein